MKGLYHVAPQEWVVCSLILCLFTWQEIPLDWNMCCVCLAFSPQLVIFIEGCTQNLLVERSKLAEPGLCHEGDLTESGTSFCLSSSDLLTGSILCHSMKVGRVVVFLHPFSIHKAVVSSLWYFPPPPPLFFLSLLTQASGTR